MIIAHLGILLFLEASLTLGRSLYGDVESKVIMGGSLSPPCVTEKYMTDKTGQLAYAVSGQSRILVVGQYGRKL